MRRHHSLLFPLLTVWAVLTFSALGIFSLVPNAYADELDQKTEGTSVEFGKEVLVPLGTVANGDTVAIMDDLIIEGEVRGNAVAVGGDVRVSGKVHGDVVGVGGEVILGENAEIVGDVTVVGAGLNRAPGARIHGSVNNVSVGNLFRNSQFNWGWRKWFTLENPISYLFYLGGLFALALLIITLFPNHVTNVAQVMEKDWGRNALVGVLTFLLMVPLTVLVAITVIGIPLIPLLWLAFFLAKMLGYVAFVTLLGIRVTSSSNLAENQLARLALGVLVLGLVRYVPVLGALVSLVVTIISLGAVIDSRFGTNKPWFPPRQTA